MSQEFHWNFQAANKCSFITIFSDYIRDFKIFIFVSCFVMWFLIMIKIKFMFMFICCLWITMLHALSVFVNHVFVIYFMNHVSENNHWFSSFIYSVRTNHEEWFSWNFFIKIDVFFLLSFIIFMFFIHILLIWSEVQIMQILCFISCH